MSKYTWIIQSSGINDEAAKKIMDACHENNISHTNIGLIPFTEKIVNIETVKEEDQRIWYGSTKLVQLINKSKYRSDLFYNDQFNTEIWNKNRSDMLNSDGKIYTLKEVLEFKEMCFVRPLEDLKAFAGEVLDNNKKDWYEEKSHGGFSIPLETKVMVSEPKNIELEWRIFLVNGNPVTGSQYKKDRRLSVALLEKEILKIAKEKARQWLPHQTVVMDLARTYDDKYYVVEFNCFNCSGFYASDLNKLVNEFEK